jgi:hypothetical protein
LTLHPGSNPTRSALEESMGRDGFEMVFGLAGGLPFTERRPAERAAAAETAAATAGAAAPRLFVRLGEPRPAPLGEMEVPVTLGVPLAALALAPVGSAFVAGSPLTSQWLDALGLWIPLPESHLTVVLRALPGAVTFARFQTTVRVPGEGRTLRFSVLHTSSGLRISGEAACVPPHAFGTRTGALSPPLVAH